MEITSGANQKLKQFRLLQKKKSRELYSLIPLEGVSLVEDALNHGIRLMWAVFSREILTPRGFGLLEILEKAGVPVLETSAALLQGVSRVESCQGIISAARMPLHSTEEVFKQPARILVLDGIQDPGNLGTLFRSALGGGITGIICTRGTVDPFNPKALRSSMGAALRAPFLKDLEPREARELLTINDLPLYCCHPRGGVSCFETKFPRRHALAIGNESRGLSPEFLESCRRVTIPLVGPVESLNAAAAGAVVVFEALRQSLAGRGEGQ